MIIAVELVWLGVVGNKEVEPAIVVIVQQCDAQRLARGIVEAGASREVLKRSIALVVEERRAFPFIPLRSAVRLVLVVE